MKSKSRYYLVITVLLALIILIFNIYKIYHQCVSVIDYSIYQQAISELSTLKVWNPYVTIRDIFIFNEHFDPIIFLAVPFFKLMNFSVYSLAIFEWLWFFGFILLAYKTEDVKDRKEFALLIALLFGLRPILSAITFIGHPVTWAIVPLFFLVKGLYRDQFKMVLYSSLVISIFKETLPFGVFFLSFFYLLKKEKTHFIILFVLGLFFILFELKFRKLLIGNTFSYGNSFIGDILANPISQTIYLFKTFHYKDFVKVFYPFVIPLYFLLKDLEFKRDFCDPIIGVFFFLFPLIGIHFIINRYSFHHASKFSAILIGMVICSGVLKQIIKSRKYFILTLILFLASGISWHKKMFKLLVLSKSTKCEVVNERVKERNIVLNKFEEVITPNDTVFVTGGVGPFIVRPGRKLLHSSWSKFPEKIDYLLFEHGAFSDIYPLNMDDVKRLVKKCNKGASEVLFKGKFFTFLKGPVSKACVEK